MDPVDLPAVVDLATSVEYWERHIPESWWGVRLRLPSDISLLPERNMVVLTSPDGVIAHLAYKDLKGQIKGKALRVLEGGTAAWVKEDLPTAGGMEKTISQPDDVWFKPYDQKGRITDFMREYLDWETGLMEQIQRDGDVRFRSFS
jgi:hypothetical protein